MGKNLFLLTNLLASSKHSRACSHLNVMYKRKLIPETVCSNIDDLKSFILNKDTSAFYHCHNFASSVVLNLMKSIGIDVSLATKWNKELKNLKENKEGMICVLLPLADYYFGHYSFNDIEEKKIAIQEGKIELDDFVYDKHTKGGKHGEAGLKKFIEEGSYVDNEFIPSGTEHFRDIYNMVSSASLSSSSLSASLSPSLSSLSASLSSSSLCITVSIG